MKMYDFCTHHFFEVLSALVGGGILVLRAIASKRSLNKIEDKLDVLISKSKWSERKK
jgi:hypothetical protein